MPCVRITIDAETDNAEAVQHLGEALERILPYMLDNIVVNIIAVSSPSNLMQVIGQES